jgi:hypothetical protein
VIDSFSMLRSVVSWLVVVLLAALSLARAEEDDPHRTRAPGPERGTTSVPLAHAVTRDQITAIERGLDFLAQRQRDNRDGSLNEKSNSNVAVTSLSVLAFLANGNTLSRGKHQASVQKAVRYLLKCVPLQRRPATSTTTTTLNLVCTVTATRRWPWPSPTA